MFKLPHRLHWYHGVLFFVLINLIAFGWGIEVPNFYANLDKPWFAPPTWIFGVIWPINVALVITGNIWAYNLYQSILERRLDPPTTNSTIVENNQDKMNLEQKLLGNLKSFGFWQVLSWINYCIFQYISFGTRIPAMFFWPTFSMWLITVISMVYAGNIDTNRGWLAIGSDKPRMQAFGQTVSKGRSIIFTFTTLIVWLSVASLLGYYIWMNN